MKINLSCCLFYNGSCIHSRWVEFNTQVFYSCMPDLLLVCFLSHAAHQRPSYMLTVFSWAHMHSVTTTTVKKLFPLFTRKASSFSVQLQITQLKWCFPCGSEFVPQLETSPSLLFNLASSTTAALTAHLSDVLYFLSPCLAVPPPPSSLTCTASPLFLQLTCISLLFHRLFPLSVRPPYLLLSLSVPSSELMSMVNMSSSSE